ncbi:hypothetical protein BMS3Bbin02_01173 [bacterium BMS3Bbin02]|nr:hypothetical protein BMS3Bbin02_01173 [bacterium BMS3Bbin02]
MPSAGIHRFLRDPDTNGSTPDRVHQQLMALVGLLNRQQRVLERLVFKLSQTTLLVGAGEDRFLGYMVDEVGDAQDEVGVIDAMRALLVTDIAENLGLDADTVSLGAIAANAPDNIGPVLDRQHKSLVRLLEEMDTVAERGAASVGSKLRLVSDSIGRMEDNAYGRTGYAAHGGYQEPSATASRYTESA